MILFHGKQILYCSQVTQVGHFRSRDTTNRVAILDRCTRLKPGNATEMTQSAKQTIPIFGLLLVFVSSLVAMRFEDGADVYVECAPYGRVKGKSFPSQYHKLPNRWINVFLGIPYAKRLEQFGNEWREKYRFMVSYV